MHATARVGRRQRRWYGACHAWHQQNIPGDGALDVHLGFVSINTRTPGTVEHTCATRAPDRGGLRERDRHTAMNYYPIRPKPDPTAGSVQYWPTESSAVSSDSMCIAPSSPV